MLTLAQEVTASFNLTLPGLIALVAGILVLAMPRLLNYVVGVYLVAIGLIELFDIAI